MPPHSVVEGSDQYFLWRAAKQRVRSLWNQSPSSPPVAPLNVQSRNSKRVPRHNKVPVELGLGSLDCSFVARGKPIRKEEGHQTSGGLSLSRSEGPTAPFCEKGAVHNPSERSHSRSLIEIKMHRPGDGCSKQQSRRRYAANGFALSPIRTVFLDGDRRDVETGPSSPSFGTEVGRPQCDKESIAPVGARGCDLRATPRRIFI